MSEIKIKAGDTVKHRPTGETWVVAFANHERGELSPCGWPESLAKLSDCELVKSCTQEESEELLHRLADLSDPDIRGSWAREELRKRVDVRP